MRRTRPRWTPRLTLVLAGSYGAAPNPVIQQFIDLQWRNAAAPDGWMRAEYMQQLRDLRARLGDFVGCDAGDIVM